MKIFPLLLFGAAGVIANNQCRRLAPGMKCTKVVIIDGEQRLIEVDLNDCKNHPNCCIKGRECVPKYKKLHKYENDSSTMLTNLYNAAVRITEQASQNITNPKRFLQVTSDLPESSNSIRISVANCNPTRNEPFVCDPPTDIPYCNRIPCGGWVYDWNRELCKLEPDCYFDEELFQYRLRFYPNPLPGVPVCHIVIRNRYYIQGANAFIESHGKWNPYFTNCLLKELDSEIRKDATACAFLPILNHFHIVPKMAGWKTINSYECALINGCWSEGRGCFYKADIIGGKATFQNTSRSTQPNEIVYGRHKCQHFDNSSPLNALKSYHRCLSAGCRVDSSISDKYYTLLFRLGNQLTPQNHWEYWNDVMEGIVGSHNIDEAFKKYSSSKPSDPVFIPPVHHNYLFQTQRNPGCGQKFRTAGGRPCPPKLPRVNKKSRFCPYKPFFIPGFPALKGSFEGCCDINLCYLPKSEIRNSNSGPSHYYTEWSSWSKCSVSCGTGIMTKTRKCVSRDKSRCKQITLVTGSCTEKTCTGWSDWSSPTPCSKSCFPGGMQSRFRRCLSASSSCLGPEKQIFDCNTHVCTKSESFPGTWTTWTPEFCTYRPYQGKCSNSKTRYCMNGNKPAGNCIGPKRFISEYKCSGCPIRG